MQTARIYDEVITLCENVKNVASFLNTASFENCGNGFSVFTEKLLPNSDISPLFLDSEYCKNLGLEFRREILENCGRFTETKPREQYLNSLFYLLRQFLDPAFTFVKSYEIPANDDQEDIPLAAMQGRAAKDVEVVRKILVNLNHIRLPLHSMLRANAADQWENYRNPVTQQPTANSQPTEPGNGVTDFESEGYSTNIRVLVAYQSGILTGTFDKLPPEKKAVVLSVLFGKCLGNVRKALSALANGTITNNPLYMPKVVEKANDLITEEGLGIPLIRNQTKS